MVTACTSIIDECHNLSFMGITSNWQWPKEKVEAWAKPDLFCPDEMGSEAYEELDKVRTYRLRYAAGTTDLSKTIEWLVGQITVSRILLKTSMPVKSYLFRFPDIIGAVRLLCMKARSYFGDEAELALGLYCDPEIDDNYLTIYVRYDDYPQDILDKIEHFGEQCSKILYGKKGRLLISTDFLRPQSNV